MNKWFKIIYALGFLIILTVAIYGTRKLTKVVKKMPDKVDHVVNQKFPPTDAADHNLNTTPQKETKVKTPRPVAQTPSADHYEDPNLGEVKLLQNEFVVADTPSNRETYPHGYAFMGLWRVPLLPNMSRPSSAMFLIRNRGMVKVASGLFSVKLVNFDRDQDRQFFTGAVIYKKRPEIDVVVYRFDKFEDLVHAHGKAQKMTEVLRSDIEVLDRPRHAN